jgi:hypothetical protein
MTAQANPSKAEGIPEGTSGQPRHDHLSALAARLVTWCGTCVDYYQAAALYEELSALSEAELQRRGLSRATLGRDVCAVCDRSGKRVASPSDVPRHRQRGEEAIVEGGPLGLYLRGWSEANPAKIIDATADGYDFYDPLVGRFSRRTLTQYFALLRARFSVGRAVRWPELAFNLRGPMQNQTSETSYQFWREAPMLGLTGASSIAMTPAGIVTETVTYDLNIACDWLRR